MSCLHCIAIRSNVCMSISSLAATDTLSISVWRRPWYIWRRLHARIDVANTDSNKPQVTLRGTSIGTALHFDTNLKLPSRRLQ